MAEDGWEAPAQPPTSEWKLIRHLFMEIRFTLPVNGIKPPLRVLLIQSLFLTEQIYCGFVRAIYAITKKLE